MTQSNNRPSRTRGALKHLYLGALLAATVGLTGCWDEDRLDEFFDRLCKSNTTWHANSWAACLTITDDHALFAHCILQLNARYAILQAQKTSAMIAALQCNQTRFDAAVGVVRPILSSVARRSGVNAGELPIGKLENIKIDADTWSQDGSHFELKFPSNFSVTSEEGDAEESQLKGSFDVDIRGDKSGWAGSVTRLNISMVLDRIPAVMTMSSGADVFPSTLVLVPNGEPPLSDCCEANGTPGCDDPACEEVVCKIDPLCCEVEWDRGCGEMAVELCNVCAEPPEFVGEMHVIVDVDYGLLGDPTWAIIFPLVSNDPTSQISISTQGKGIPGTSVFPTVESTADPNADCNGNGIPDGTDIESGFSSDCNFNGRPDECDIADESATDCNANGVPDVCEMTFGPACDSNANGIMEPDCERVDCNSNGVPDCDELEKLDTDFDGIIDECEVDCNENGIHDLYDIVDGTSKDKNLNGIPDECECLWDLDANGSVGASDLLLLLASWGPCKGCDADFDGDGTVGASDLLELLANWGPCP